MKLSELKTMTQKIPDLQGEQLQQWLREYLTEIGMDPNAIYQELEMTSRFVDTHRDTSYVNAQLQLHSHTFFELLYCINDCDEFSLRSRSSNIISNSISFLFSFLSKLIVIKQKIKQIPQCYVFKKIAAWNISN